MAPDLRCYKYLSKDGSQGSPPNPQYRGYKMRLSPVMSFSVYNMTPKYRGAWKGLGVSGHHTMGKPKLRVKAGVSQGYT